MRQYFLVGNLKVVVKIGSYFFQLVKLLATRAWTRGKFLDDLFFNLSLSQETYSTARAWLGISFSFKI
ncbi:MAG: hypothetical protein B5M54_03410 [Candidatus Aminicenantes bacterium 4484_214]|nr:MAG: hypothetical protein B5M54_03410 [Candidatus Aminicenantes bacterium 4484_214]RLE10111.1 MAG: hypothetical protein DRJ06_01640 [Candidatus Aminicenantes bacterium]